MFLFEYKISAIGSHIWTRDPPLPPAVAAVWEACVTFSGGLNQGSKLLREGLEV